MHVYLYGDVCVPFVQRIIYELFLDEITRLPKSFTFRMCAVAVFFFKSVFYFSKPKPSVTRSWVTFRTCVRKSLCTVWFFIFFFFILTVHARYRVRIKAFTTIWRYVKRVLASRSVGAITQTRALTSPDDGSRRGSWTVDEADPSKKTYRLSVTRRGRNKLLRWRVAARSITYVTRSCSACTARTIGVFRHVDRSLNYRRHGVITIFGRYAVSAIDLGLYNVRIPLVTFALALVGFKYRSRSSFVTTLFFIVRRQLGSGRHANDTASSYE